MYEFVDKVDRYEVQTAYWDFLESEEEDAKKAIKKLKDIIKKDPDFFDPYVTLAEYYQYVSDDDKAFSVMKKGYDRAMDMVVHKGKFPDELSWLFMENRHIIRMIFNYAMLLWEKGEVSEAKRIFGQLLASNPNDNIGARYAILSILEGLPSMSAYEKMFATKEGYLDAIKIDDWFNKNASKYLDDLGWWLELEE